jgi:hypothetical protein
MTLAQRSAAARPAWLAAAIALAGSASCVAPVIQTRYGPLHPDTNVSVEFRVQGKAAIGIRKVELFLFEYEVTSAGSGSWAGSLRPGGRWGRVASKSYPYPFPPAIDETFVQPGFPAKSYVRYLFRVTQALGATTSEAWSFAAGEWNFGNDPIPILARGQGDQSLALARIDLCFVADREDYADGRAMLEELESLIFDGYQANNALEGPMRFNWSFHYSPETGYISPSKGDAMDIPDLVKYSPVIDAAAVIHRQNQLDWSSSRFFGTEPFNVGTALHETGHAVFSLADEYASGAHFASASPHHNNYAFQAAAEAYNTGQGWPPLQAEPINTAATWWRPEPQSLACIMFEDNDAALPDFARSCILRVRWWYGQLASSLHLP